MIEGFSDTALLRMGILAAALILFAVIFFTSRKKPEQGKRLAGSSKLADSERRLEPTLSADTFDADRSGSMDIVSVDIEQPELELPEPNNSEHGAVVRIGARPSTDFDKIVTLYIAARAGQELIGSDLVVAAEKAGLVYGHMDIFHRMVDKNPEQGPIFSVANLIKPGSFDLRSIKDLRTPGISFFMALPGPLSALDAWDTLLPTAQRMAELLDAVLLDEQRNALGRQRIASIRDELRAYDRARDKLNIHPGR